MDWQKLLFDPAHNLYERVVTHLDRKFFQDVDVENWLTEILTEYQQQDWKQLAGYKNGHTSPSTFFCTVITREVIDRYRKKYGRCTVPIAVKRLGVIWESLYRSLCCDRKEPQQLSIEFSQDFESEQRVTVAIRQLKKMDPKCGHRGFKPITQQLEPDDVIVTATIDDKFELEQFQFVLSVIAKVYGFSRENETHSSDVTDSDAVQDFAKALIALEIPDEELLLFQCVYDHGLKLSEATDIIGLPYHTARKMLISRQKQLAQLVAKYELHFLRSLV